MKDIKNTHHFRYKISSEDLLVYDEEYDEASSESDVIMKDTKIRVVSSGLDLFIGYNHAIMSCEKNYVYNNIGGISTFTSDEKFFKAREKLLTKYVNPMKISNKDDVLLDIYINGFLSLNDGLTANNKGIVDMAEFINKNYVNRNVISVKELVDRITNFIGTDYYRFINNNGGGYLIHTKYVFFSVHSVLEKKDKASYSLAYLHRIKRERTIGLIEISISILQDMDRFTFINNSRIAKDTGLNKSTVSRRITSLQSKRIVRLNSGRLFNQERTTKAYFRYINDKIHYDTIGINRACFELGISRSNLNVFKAQ